MVWPPSEQMVGAVTNLTKEDSPSFFAHLPLPSDRGATSSHHLFTVLSSNNTFTANIIACVNWQCKTSPQAIDKVWEIQYVQKYFYLLLSDHSPRITKRGKEQQEDPENHSWLAHSYLLNTPQHALCWAASRRLAGTFRGDHSLYSASELQCCIEFTAENIGCLHIPWDKQSHLLQWLTLCRRNSSTCSSILLVNHFKD